MVPSLAVAVLAVAGPGAVAAVDPSSRSEPSATEPAGPPAGEGRPHPGRDADLPDLGPWPDRQAPGEETAPDRPPAAGPADHLGAPAGPAGPHARAPRRAPAPLITPRRPATGEAGKAGRAGQAGKPDAAAGARSAPRPLAPRPFDPRPAPTDTPRAAASRPVAAVPEPAREPADLRNPSSVQTAQVPSGRSLRILSLGTGLAFLGAGIGVMAVRLRRLH